MAGLSYNNVHATCISVDGRGVLLRGQSGSGKSDLALRLIDRGALLVADDLVCLSIGEHGDQVLASLPTAAEARRGVMEVRNLGLVRVPHAPAAQLFLVIDLDLPVERYPERQTADILGVMIGRLILNPFEASAVVKVTAALSWEVLDG